MKTPAPAQTPTPRRLDRAAARIWNGIKTAADIATECVVVLVFDMAGFWLVALFVFIVVDSILEA